MEILPKDDLSTVGLENIFKTHLLNTFVGTFLLAVL
jgi:hypothetical protein